MQVKPIRDIADVAKLESSAISPSLPPIVSALELYQGKLVRLRPFFEDLFWDGLTMLVARPKAGKSWLTLQCAVCIAGGPAIEGIQVIENGPVLYFALEEPAARTVARLQKIAPAGDWASRLHIVYDLLPLMGGGAEQIRALIAQLRPRVVIIDTLTAAIKSSSKRGDGDVFRSQYNEVSCLRKIAEEYQLAILLVHHVRKGISDGAIEAVAGTGGIAAAVDTVWQLKRKPEGEATLDVVGRETEDRTLALRFEQDPFGWRVLGDDAAQLLNSDRRQILELLRDDGALTPAQVAAEIGKSRAATRMMLKRMKDDCQIKKQGLKYVPSLSMSYSVTERDRE